HVFNAQQKHSSIKTAGAQRRNTMEMACIPAQKAAPVSSSGNRNHLRADVYAGIARAAAGDVRSQHALPAPDIENLLTSLKFQQLQHCRNRKLTVVMAAICANPPIVPIRNRLPAGGRT